jgi:microcompartment protein CcmL/EutN
MATPKSIGAIELSSIALGFQVQDAMLKAAEIEIIVARTICSGKYLVVFAGSVNDVKAALSAGLAAPEEAVIDHLALPNVHESVFPALGQSVLVEEDEPGALGVLETYSGVSILAAADAAAKAANVKLIRIHVAMALGGKGYCLMTGTVGDCRAAVAAGAAVARQRGLLVNEVTIPRPRKELLSEYF